LSRAGWQRARRADFSPETYLSDYLKAFEINPKSLNALLMIGVVYMEDLKDLVRAEAIFRQAERLFPENRYVYYYLGNVLAAQDNLVGAIAAYQKSIALYPDWQAPKDRLKDAQARLEAAP
jgi:tetratricopeptide (TPR) repeat protein